jgi:hypothetical protein
MSLKRAVALVGAVVAVLSPPGTTALALAPATTFVAGSGPDQVYAVPGDVRLLMVEAIGAAGGGDVGVAGLGARLQAALPVMPGGRLDAYVGETSANYPLGGAPGGTIDGQSGGGASVVRVCAVPGYSGADDDCNGTVAEPRLIVAGGGGGAGGGSDGPAVCGVSPVAGSAGTGSALSAPAGVVVLGGSGASVAPSTAAQGGSTSGGAGGKAAGCIEGLGLYARAADGDAGVSGYGGPSGDVLAGSHSSPVAPRYSGGGGGAGYFGGGGGSTGQEDGTTCPSPDVLPAACRAEVAGGGGGAGSSFVAAAATLLPGTLGASSRQPAITVTPLVAIARPRDGVRYRQQRAVRPVWQCRLERCRASRRIDTSTPGRHAFTVTGELDGLRFQARASYTVLRRQPIR